METQKEDNSKEQAKNIKEEGNAHYKKKELDMAIQKYDEVILKQKMAVKLTKINLFCHVAYQPTWPFLFIKKKQEIWLENGPLRNRLKLVQS